MRKKEKDLASYLSKGGFTHPSLVKLMNHSSQEYLTKSRTAFHHLQEKASFDDLGCELEQKWHYRYSKF